MSNLQAGDVVYLKSGGPAMTVTLVGAYAGEDGEEEVRWADVTWFLEGEVKMHTFREPSLTTENPRKAQKPLTGGI